MHLVSEPRRLDFLAWLKSHLMDEGPIGDLAWNVYEDRGIDGRVARAWSRGRWVQRLQGSGAPPAALEVFNAAWSAWKSYVAGDETHAVPRRINPRALSMKQRFAVLRRCGFRCVYCGTPGAEVQLVVDHARSVVEGGDRGADNLVAACRPCNIGKATTSCAPAQARPTSAAVAAFSAG
jgi:hypothetical protein